MAATVQREIRVSVFYFLGLMLAALATDAILHGFGLVWIGRSPGPLGLALILFSFVYSVRRRKFITGGKIPSYLRFHEFAAWLGSLLVLVHSGIHFNALIPWLATLAMLVTTASGLTGKFLLKSAQFRLKEQKAGLETSGMTPEAVEAELLSEARMVEAMRKWRVLHLPITLSFALLALAHLGSLWYFG